jgi:hypothetical protein
MGQFKPMVKMMTTEPSVELKLKKGGKVEKKMQMGGMPAPAMPARGGMMPARTPMKPSMAARRRAMMAMPAGAAPAAPVGMAGRMMKEGGESKSTHKAEMKAIKGLKSEMQSHRDKPASKAHKGLKTGGMACATGGVVMGQGGYKKGGMVKMAGVPKSGIINTENQGGAYRDTMMHTAKTDHSPAKTGEVKLGNGGGYATGGVAKSNGGGYRKGGAAKKGYAAGGVVDSGAPVAMPQGRKKPSTPVSINQLSGTFKKGGSVTAAEGRLQKNFKSENATAMKQAKAYSNEVYSKYGKKMNEGGKVDLSKGAYDKSIGPTEEEMNMAKAIRSIPSRIFEGAKSLFGQGSITEAERKTLQNAIGPSMQGSITEAERRALRNAGAKPAGSVTKTEKSVTVEPAKKRGGLAKC